MDLWSRARRLREERGLSQAVVAGRIGTSQSWVARMESGEVDPSLSSVRRYLDAIGASLELRSDDGLPDFRAMSLADLARSIRRHLADGEYVLRACLQFIDDFHETDEAGRSGLLETAPAATGDPRWDAFLAGLAEHLAYHGGLPVPRWTQRKERFLRTWWFLSDLPSVRASAMAESPAAFRRRGVFVTDDLFARA